MVINTNIGFSGDIQVKYPQIPAVFDHFYFILRRFLEKSSTKTTFIEFDPKIKLNNSKWYMV